MSGGLIPVNNLVFLLLVLSVFVIGCEMSDEMSNQEKRRLAKSTCAIIGATRGFESSRRVELVNNARSQLGEPPYLDGDETIIDSVTANTCLDLVLNDPEYRVNTILGKMDAEFDKFGI